MIKYQQISKKEVKVLENKTFVLKDTVFTIPKGFISDGASVPKPLQWLLGKPFAKRLVRAGIFHDFLYKTRIIGKLKADVLYYKKLKEAGVGLAKRLLHFTGLTLFGWIKYYF